MCAQMGICNEITKPAPHPFPFHSIPSHPIPTPFPPSTKDNVLPTQPPPLAVNTHTTTLTEHTQHTQTDVRNAVCCPFAVRTDFGFVFPGQCDHLAYYKRAVVGALRACHANMCCNEDSAWPLFAQADINEGHRLIWCAIVPANHFSPQPLLQQPSLQDKGEFGQVLRTTRQSISGRGSFVRSRAAKYLGFVIPTTRSTVGQMSSKCARALVDRVCGACVVLGGQDAASVTKEQDIARCRDYRANGAHR